MARPRTKIKAVCQNKECHYYGKEAGKNITKQGKNTAGHQRFMCWHCHTYFTDTKGTPLYNLKTNERKIKAECKEFMEGKGIRGIERTIHLHRDTVSHHLDLLGKHAEELIDYLVHNLGLSSYEVDELFATIQKKRRGLNQKEMTSLAEARKLLQHA